MKKAFFVILLLICTTQMMYTQEYYPFTAEELIEIANHTRELELADSLNTIIISAQKEKILLLQQSAIIDSLKIDNGKKEILWLKSSKKEHWYENRYLWFGYGIGLMLGASWAMGNISK